MKTHREYGWPATTRLVAVLGFLAFVIWIFWG